jgi:two-component system NarL family response regulator
MLQSRQFEGIPGGGKFELIRQSGGKARSTLIEYNSGRQLASTQRTKRGLIRVEGKGAPAVASKRFFDYFYTVPLYLSPDPGLFSMKTIRILLVEDNRILREGIAAMLNGEKDMTVMPSSGGDGGTLAEVRKLKPHVVLLDLGLRNQNGLHVVNSVSKEFPGVKVIGMGLIPSQLDIIEWVEAGASGFILKDATVEDFLATVRSVARGTKVLPPSLAGSLFSHVIDNALKKGKGKLASAVRMTKREREIISLIAEGLSNKEIAQRLNVATYTVKSHVHNILEKLALHSRLQIAMFTHNEEVP